MLAAGKSERRLKFLSGLALPFLIAVLAWTALALQLVLFLHYFAAAGRPWPDALARYSSFFSILTHLFIAVMLTGALLVRDAQSIFRRAGVQSAAAVYILVIMLVYILLLRRAWNPLGPQFIVNMLLHYVVPVLYALYWLIGVPKGGLAWSDPCAGSPFRSSISATASSSARSAANIPIASSMPAPSATLTFC